MQQVDELQLGPWMEFQGVEAQRIRCSLASKIDNSDQQPETVTFNSGGKFAIISE